MEDRSVDKSATKPYGPVTREFRRPSTLMEGLRNLEKGYDRKFALSYCADDVWKALEALERIANHDLHVDYADCELRTIARRALT